MFLLESPNTISSIFSICLTLLLALNEVEGGVLSTEIMKSLYWHVCAFRSALDTAHVVNCSCICCEQIELFLSLVRITSTCDYPYPAIGVGIFVRGLIILVFLLCLFHSIHVSIWACLQKEEIFGSFHLMK